jgi:hypothetical protein
MHDPRIVQVRSWFTLRSFDTPKEAIEALEGTSRFEQARLDSVAIAGQTMTRFIYDAGRLHLCLSGGEILEVIAAEGKVEWHLVKGTGLANARSFAKPEAINLRFENGGVDIFEPASLLKSRESFPLSKLFGGDFFLNIYFRRGGVLQFAPLWNESDQTPLLYFSELEPIPVPGEPLPIWLQSRK